MRSPGGGPTNFVLLMWPKASFLCRFEWRTEWMNGRTGRNLLEKRTLLPGDRPSNQPLRRGKFTGNEKDSSRCDSIIKIQWGCAI